MASSSPQGSPFKGPQAASLLGVIDMLDSGVSTETVLEAMKQAGINLPQPSYVEVLPENMLLTKAGTLAVKAANLLGSSTPFSILESSDFLDFLGYRVRLKEGKEVSSSSGS